MLALFIVACILTVSAGGEEEFEYEDNILGIFCRPNEFTIVDRSMRMYLMLPTGPWPYNPQTFSLELPELSHSLSRSWKRKIWKEDYEWKTMVREFRDNIDLMHLKPMDGNSTEGLYHLTLIKWDDGRRIYKDPEIPYRNRTLHMVTIIERSSCERFYFSYYWHQEDGDTFVSLYDFQRQKSTKLCSYEDWKERQHVLPKYLLSYTEITGLDQEGVIIYMDEKWKYGSFHFGLQLKSIPGRRFKLQFVQREVKPESIDYEY